jgi:hypothetical protein
MQDLKHKILLVLIALTIIGEAATIVIWIVNPILPLGQQARLSLVVDYRIAIASDVVFVALNLVACLWVIRRDKKGPLFLIAISVTNRLISVPMFIGVGFTVFAAWTIIMSIFAYLDYRQMSKRH